MKACLSALAASAVLSAAWPALAQEQSAEADPALLESAIAVAGPGVPGSPISFSGFEFTAGTEGAQITLKQEWDIVAQGGGRHVFGVTLLAPFDKDKGEGGFALGDLTADSSIQLSYRFAELRGVVTGNTSAANTLCSEIRASLNEPAGHCSSGFIAERAPHRLGDWNRLGFAPDAAVWLAGLTAEIGHAEFEFLVPATFAEQTESETPWSVGAFVAVQPLSTTSLFTLRIQHQRTYEAADEMTVCVAGNPVCLTGPLGSPDKDTKEIASFEYRQLIGGRFGFSLTSSYDFANNVAGVDLPIYFIGGEGYGGGVRFAYERDDDDTGGGDDEWKIGVFVRKSFTLY